MSADRITAAEYQDVIAGQNAAEKGRVRGTQKLVVQGIKFDSKREANHWLVLRDREKRGEIRDLKLQVVYDLFGRDSPILTPTGRTMQYWADFRFFDLKEQRWRVQDAKGHQTDTSIMKLAIMAAQGVKVELV